MAEFVTISLENNECDICHHDNGEELISYVLNDRCIQQQEIWSNQTKSTNEQIRKAHSLCLDRWDHIMKRSLNRFSPLRRSWSCGKQSILTKVHSSSHEDLIISTTWTAIKSHSQERLYSVGTDNNSNQPICESPAQKTKKLIRNIQDTHTSRPLLRRDIVKHGTGTGTNKVVSENLSQFCVAELHEKVLEYKSKIKDISGQLIVFLQERDALKQETEVRRVAIEQLLKLQTGCNKSQSVIKDVRLAAKQKKFLHV